MTFLRDANIGLCRLKTSLRCSGCKPARRTI